MNGPITVADAVNPLFLLDIDDQGRIRISNLPDEPPLIQTVYVDNSSFPVTGPLTNTQLRASAVPVSGPVTDAQLRAAAVPVSGPVTDAQLRATPLTVVANVGTGTQPVSLATLPALAAGTANIGDVDVLTLPALPAGTNNIGDVDVLTLPPLPAGTSNIGDVDVLTLPALTPQAGAGSAPHAVASLGNSLGKTNVMRTGGITTSATTANQVILTYTVTAGKTLYLQYFALTVRLTTFAATATLFGEASLESPAGTKVYTMDLAGPGINTPLVLTFDEPVPVAGGTVIRVVCTPNATAAMTWKANLGGYEK